MMTVHASTVNQRGVTLILENVLHSGLLYNPANTQPVKTDFTVVDLR